MTSNYSTVSVTANSILSNDKFIYYHRFLSPKIVQTKLY